MASKFVPNGLSKRGIQPNDNACTLAPAAMQLNLSFVG